MLNIKELKKTDLHCHLDGSLSATTLSHFLHRTPDFSELSVDDSCTSLTEYLKKFDLPLHCLQTKANLELAAYTFLKELAADQMKYIEVRFAPTLSTQDGLSCEDVIESVLRGLEKGKSETRIDYNVITCAMRHFAPEQNMQLLDSMEKYVGHGVCALDLAGDESKFPNPLFHELFEEARHRKIPFVIHSGETGNVENVRTAMEYGAAHRPWSCTDSRSRPDAGDCPKRNRNRNVPDKQSPDTCYRQLEQLPTRYLLTCRRQSQCQHRQPHRQQHNDGP